MIGRRPGISIFRYPKWSKYLYINGLFRIGGGIPNKIFMVIDYLRYIAKEYIYSSKNKSQTTRSLDARIRLSFRASG